MKSQAAPINLTQSNANNAIIQDLRNYHGNSNLLLAGQEYHYTQHEIDEFAKCANDLEYFVENYIKIVHVDRGLIPFMPWPFQKKMLQTIRDNRFTICKLPRQCGKTTTTVAYLLWYVLFNKNVNVAILAHRSQTAQELFAKVRLAYEHLPLFLQAGIAPGGWNMRSIRLGNGSKIKADATSSGSIRGESFNLIFLDEFAFVENNLADEFFKSVFPTISSGKTTKVVIVSTPQGLNHFYEMWEKATKKNEDGTPRSEFQPIEIKWNDVPGRDEVWKKQQIEILGPNGFKQEFDTEFIGSSNTLIEPEMLLEMQRNVKPPIAKSEGLRIYEQAIPGHRYAICVDTSRGQGLDYHAFCIVDVTNFPYILVGMFQRNDIHPTLLPNVIFAAAKNYNYATVLIEISDVGSQVADMLISDLDCDNVIRVSSRPGKGQTIGFGVGSKVQNGLKTSPATKRIGCVDLKALVESRKLIIPDEPTVKELLTFVSDLQSFSAEEGKHDDCVMSLVIFGWLSHQRYFRHETMDIRAELERVNEEYLETQLTPFGILDDGLDFIEHNY